MVEVALYTNDGREVTRIQMPPFVSWPEGILWGSRCFFRGLDMAGDGTSAAIVYREGMLWVDPGTLTVQKPVSEAES